MRAYLLLCAVLLATASQAGAASDEQDCLGFSKQDLAIIMRSKLGEGYGGVLDRTGRFGNFTAVVRQCNAALSQAPDDQALQLQLARALLAQTEFKAAAAALQSLVKADQPTALRLYGVLLSYGIGIPGDADAGQALLMRAADLGDPVAPLVMGMIMLTWDKQGHQSRPWFVRALQTGSAAAEYVVADEIDQGNGMGFTQEDKLRLYRDSAAKGWPPAMLMLAAILREGKEVPPDPAQAEELERRAKAIQPEAGLELRSYWWYFG